MIDSFFAQFLAQLFCFAINGLAFNTQPARLGNISTTIPISAQ
jgi:hypothetical protein